MNKGFSLWLDVLRVLATIVVVVAHWAFPRYTNGDFAIIRDWNIGSDAVIVFFVISGTVIAYAAGRDRNLGTFAFNRFTRLWSVLFPALLLTFLIDWIGFGISPESYPPNFYQTGGFTGYMLRGLSFSSEFGLLGRVRLGSNGPLWSISYEAAYYALFAVLVFLRGPWKFLLLAAMIAVIGIPILALMPSWLLGVWLWHALRRGDIVPGSQSIALCLAIGAPLVYAALNGAGLPPVLRGFTADLLGVSKARYVLGYSDELIWNGIIGVLTSIHLVGMARLLENRIVKGSWVRWAAGASFSVYVTHFPILHFLDSVLPEPMPGRYVVLLVTPFVVGVIFAAVFERNLKERRQALRRFRPATIKN